MSDAKTMHIGEVAERTSLSLRTLRHYDEIGLVNPSGRTEGGFRLYTDDDVRRLLLIRRMKPLGYSLEQMGDLLRVLDGNGPGDDTEAGTVLRDFRVDAAERRDRLAHQLEMADEFLEQLDRI